VIHSFCCTTNLYFFAPLEGVNTDFRQMFRKKKLIFSSSFITIVSHLRDLSQIWEVPSFLFRHWFCRRPIWLHSRPSVCNIRRLQSRWDLLVDNFCQAFLKKLGPTVNKSKLLTQLSIDEIRHWITSIICWVLFLKSGVTDKSISMSWLKPNFLNSMRVCNQSKAFESQCCPTRTGQPPKESRIARIGELPTFSMSAKLVANKSKHGNTLSFQTIKTD